MFRFFGLGFLVPTLNLTQIDSALAERLDQTWTYLVPGPVNVKPLFENH